MRFVIDRSRWFRGQGSNTSRLLVPANGKQCCVGQMCSQLGVSDERLSDVGTVMSLLPLLEDPNQVKPFVELLPVPKESDWLNTAYSLNDNVCYCEDEREAELSELFAANGHELVFTD